MSLPPVYLVDASVYIFRAWFSMPDEFVNAAGEHANAVYGFSGFLCSLLEQTAAEHVAIAFDESLTTSYRNEIYPEYKANRPAMPDELREQIGPTLDIIRAMGLPLLIVDNVEADDVIGTASGIAKGNALNWSYTLALPYKDSTVNVQFDDWMFLQQDGVLINRAKMKKFGFTLGEVTLFFKRDASGG